MRVFPSKNDEPRSNQGHPDVNQSGFMNPGSTSCGCKGAGIRHKPGFQNPQTAKRTIRSIGVLFGCFVRKIDGFPGLPGGFIIYQGHLFPLKGHLWSGASPTDFRPFRRPPRRNFRSTGVEARRCRRRGRWRWASSPARWGRSRA